MEHKVLKHLQTVTENVLENLFDVPLTRVYETFLKINRVSWCPVDSYVSPEINVQGVSRILSKRGGVGPPISLHICNTHFQLRKGTVHAWMQGGMANSSRKRPPLLGRQLALQTPVLIWTFERVV